MSKSNKATIISFSVLFLLGWYGGIDYNERTSFNSAYVFMSMILSWIVAFVISDISKEAK